MATAGRAGSPFIMGAIGSVGAARWLGEGYAVALNETCTHTPALSHTHTYTIPVVLG